MPPLRRQQPGERALRRCQVAMLNDGKNEAAGLLESSPPPNSRGRERNTGGDRILSDIRRCLVLASERRRGSTPVPKGQREKIAVGQTCKGGVRENCVGGNTTISETGFAIATSAPSPCWHTTVDVQSDVARPLRALLLFEVEKTRCRPKKDSLSSQEKPR